MSDAGLCSACGVWMCRDDDACCGFCGAPRAKLSLELLPDVLYVDERPPRICVRITNHSCSERKLQEIALPDWLSNVGIKKIPPIPANQSASFFLGVNGLLDQEKSGVVEIAFDAGTARGEVAVIHRLPKFLCNAEPLLLWRDLDGRKNSEPIQIRPASGVVKVLSVDAADETLAVTADLGPAGRMIDEHRPLEVHIGLGPKAEVEAPPPQQRQSEKILLLGYQTPNGPQTAKINVQIVHCRMPELHWPDEFMSPEVRYQTAGQRLKLTLCNLSKKDSGLLNGFLVVSEATLSASQLPGVDIRCLTPLPVEVVGGGSSSLEFELDLSSQQGAPEVLTELSLRVVTNLTTKEWNVPLKVEKMPVYSGVVAIDFGSSNSCCAVWQEGGAPELLKLDDRSGVVSPTVVRYRGIEPPPPSIETGSRPKELAARYTNIAASTADHLKQRLSDERQLVAIRPEDDAKWIERSICDITTDYLRDIRHKAELVKGARFRDFILTHPARCSLRQYKYLRRALQQAFDADDKDIRVHFLPEPVAALVSYIADREKVKKEEQNGYVIAAFDLGGGTTDMSIIEVEYRTLRQGQTRIVPHVLYSCGDRFGGDDLTDYLRELLAKRVGKFIVQDRFRESNYLAETPQLITDGMTGGSVETVRLNKNSLQMVAERFKLSLSDEATALPEFIEVHLLVGVNAAAFSIRFVDIQTLDGNDLAEEFLAYASEEIVRRVKMLQNAIQVTGALLDVIQISGKTAHLPVVREALAEAFPQIAIVRAPDPKECVVKGACLTRAMRRGVSIDLKMDTLSMTSTIGAYGFDSEYFQPILTVGQAIPNDGLVGVLPRAWRGSEDVVLWEDLNGTNEKVTDTKAAHYFNNLGTWAPETQCDIEDDDAWDIRLTLRDFQLEMVAVGPNQRVVAFHPM